MSYIYKETELDEKFRRLEKHNTNVSEIRCFDAVQNEVINTLTEFFKTRIPETEFKELEPLRHILPSTTDDQLRECHKLIVPDVPLSDFVMSYREVLDHLPSKEREELNPRDLYQYVCKTECWNALSVALARLLAAKPHSADVERLISSYNELKSPGRSSLSASTLRATLFIRHNLPPVAHWDPRPATYQWMTAKDRRPSQNPVKAKQQDYFKGVLF